MKPIAVEAGLDPVRDYLAQQGLHVVGLRNGAPDTQDVSCIVVTGADQNLMGMQDVTVDVPVVSTDGLTPSEVYQRIKPYLQ